ncbi:hypothetical protein [Nocardioides sp.]|uniref:hypothetical protein n=1 Tax=Nocardioides sp. TaxID=35761 RepID=UPI0026379936|nr:hypothetical protein [Nocardioides sp.]
MNDRASDDGVPYDEPERELIDGLTAIHLLDLAQATGLPIAVLEGLEDDGHLPLLRSVTDPSRVFLHETDVPTAAELVAWGTPPHGDYDRDHFLANGADWGGQIPPWFPATDPADPGSWTVSWDDE